MEDRTEQVTSALADVSERLTEYADVWRTAVERNADSAYGADDFLVDLQTLWGMGVRDVARVGFAVAEALAPSQAGDTPAGAAPRKAAPRKQGRKTASGKQPQKPPRKRAKKAAARKPKKRG